MDSIETIDAIFQELFDRINNYTKSKYNNKLKKDIERAKRIVMELEGNNCIDVDTIIKCIEPRNLMLQ